jgi:hypothetical protein
LTSAAECDIRLTEEDYAEMEDNYFRVNLRKWVLDEHECIFGKRNPYDKLYKPRPIKLRSRALKEFRSFLKRSKTYPAAFCPSNGLIEIPNPAFTWDALKPMTDALISKWRRQYWLLPPHLNGGHKNRGWENVGRHSVESNCTCHHNVRLTKECSQFDPGFPRSRGNGGMNPNEYDDVRRYELMCLQTIAGTSSLKELECEDTTIEQPDSCWALPIEGGGIPAQPWHVYGAVYAPAAQPTLKETEFWEDRLRVAAAQAGEKYSSPEVRGIRTVTANTAIGGGRPIRKLFLYFDGEQFVESDREDLQDTQHITFEGRVSQQKRYTDRKTREAARKEIVIANGQEILDTDGELTQQAKEAVALLETVLENRAAAEAAKEAGMSAETLRKRRQRLLDKARRTLLDDALEVLDRITSKQWADIEEHGGIRAFTLSPNGRAEMLKFSGDEHHYVVYHRSDAEKAASGWTENEANLCDGLCNIGTKRSRSKEKWARAICFNFGDSGFVSKFTAENPIEDGKFEAAWNALAASGRRPQPYVRGATASKQAA